MDMEAANDEQRPDLSNRSNMRDQARQTGLKSGLEIVCLVLAASRVVRPETGNFPSTAPAYDEAERILAYHQTYAADGKLQD